MVVIATIVCLIMLVLLNKLNTLIYEITAELYNIGGQLSDINDTLNSYEREVE